MAISNSYKNTVLSDSPIRYYRLDETSGTSATDIGSGAHNGTYTGGFTLNQTSLLKGDSDASATFNGTTGYVSIPTTGLPTGTNTWSVEAWVNFSSLVNAPQVFFIGTNASNQAIELYYSATNSRWQADLNGATTVNGAAATANTTYYLVATYDGTQLRLYVNGSLVGGPTTVTANVTLGTAQIGCFNASSEFCTGRIDEAAIYSTTLSASQVSNHWNAGIAVTKSTSIRTRVATKVTKSAAVRSVIRTLNTVSSKIRTVIATKTTRSLVVRTPVRTQVTKSTPLRAVIRGRTLVSQLRAVVSVLTTKSTAIRTRVTTKITKSTVLRFIIRALVTSSTKIRTVVATKTTRSVPVRTRVRTQTTQSTALRAVIRGRTLVSQLRTVVRTLSTKSTPVRTRISTKVTKSAVFRAVVRGVTKLVQLRILVNTTSAYKSAILSDSPIRYYRLDEMSGTSATDSGSQNQAGTYTGGFTFGSTSLIMGDMDSSVVFDGSTGYVSIPTTSLPSGASAWSVECWTLLTDLSNAPQLFFIGSNTANQAIELYYSSTNNRWQADLNGATIVSSASSASANTVYHLVVTYDGTQLRLYVNGSLVGGPTTVTSNVTLSVAQIGCFNATSEFCTGYIDEPAIYSTALPATRIAAHYNTGIHAPSYTQWSGIGMNYGEDTSDIVYSTTQVESDFTYLRSIGITRIRINMPEYDSASISNFQDVVTRALSHGFYVIWGVTAGFGSGTLTATRWSAAKTYITGTLVPWAQSNGLSELCLTNESELSADGTTLTASTIRSDIRSMASSIKSGGFTGKVSYNTDVLSATRSPWASEGLGSLDYIGFNSYDVLANFDARNDLSDFPTGKAYISEFGSTGGGYPDFNNETLFYNDTVGRINSLRSWNVPSGYFFCYRDGQQGVTADTFALIQSSGVAHSAINAVTGTVNTTKSTVIRSVIRTLTTASTKLRIVIGPSPLASNSYKNTVLADSPTAYYRMDDSSGTTALDSSGNGNNAKLSGTFTLSQTGLIAGDSDASILLNGITGMLTLPYTLNPSTWSSLTLEFWIKITSGPMHVVITVDSTSTTLYLNGQVYTTGSGGDAILIDKNILYGGSYSNGDLDEIALYQNTKLSASRIAAHYAAGLAITKSVGVRTRVATKVSKSIAIRARVRVQNTLSTILRTLVRTPKTTSAPIRSIIQTKATKSAVMRAIVRGVTLFTYLRAVIATHLTKTTAVRTRVRTTMARSLVLRVITTVSGTTATLSSILRSVIRTLVSKSAPIRARIATQRIGSSPLRSVVRTSTTRSVPLRIVARGITLVSKLRMLIRILVTRSLGVRTVIRSTVTRSAVFRAVIQSKVIKSTVARLVLATKATRSLALRILSATSATRIAQLRAPIRTSVSKSLPTRVRVRTTVTPSLVIRVITTADGVAAALFVQIRSRIATKNTPSTRIRTMVRTSRTLTIPLRLIARGITLLAPVRVRIQTRVTRSVVVRSSVRTLASLSVRVRILARTLVVVSTRLRTVIRTQVSKSVVIRLLLRTQRSLTSQIRLVMRSTQTRSLVLRIITRTPASRSLVMRTLIGTKIGKTIGVRLPVRSQRSLLATLRTIIRTPQSRSLPMRIKARTQVSRSFVLRVRTSATKNTSVMLRVMVVAPAPVITTVQPVVTPSYPIGPTGCFPITAPLTFPLLMNGTILDTPAIVTAPLLQGGQVLTGQSFTLTWISASSTTQTAMANGTTGSMTFAVHDGSLITAPVRVVSVTVGSMLITTITVTANTPIDKRVIKTQFY